MLLLLPQEPGTTYAWAEMGLAALRFLQQTQIPLCRVNQMMVQTLALQIDGLFEDVRGHMGRATLVTKVGSVFDETTRTCASCKHTGFCFLLKQSQYADWLCRLCFKRAGAKAYSMMSMFDWDILNGNHQ